MQVCLFSQMLDKRLFSLSSFPVTIPLVFACFLASFFFIQLSIHQDSSLVMRDAHFDQMT